nr:hypothetical protein HmN_000932800 [Hymenolepis microstoma]
MTLAPIRRWSDGPETYTITTVTVGSIPEALQQFLQLPPDTVQDPLHTTELFRPILSPKATYVKCVLPPGFSLDDVVSFVILPSVLERKTTCTRRESYTSIDEVTWLPTYTIRLKSTQLLVRLSIRPIPT